MSSLLFPDVNVWVALGMDGHAHHAAAKRWYETLPETGTLVFCRQTQLGLFRIFTTAAIMQKDVLTMQGCWRVFDLWVATGQVAWADEPLGLEELLRTLTVGVTVSPKIWMDAYLAAWAEAGNLTLVTFDRALAGKVKGAVLLG